MDNLRHIVTRAVADLTQVLTPLHEQDDKIKQRMNEDANLAENLANLGARDAVIRTRMEAISWQKQKVEGAASKCEPQGKDKELVTVFFYFVKTLQSDCHKVREYIQAWGEILNAVDLLQKQKQEVLQEESKRTKEIVEMKAKDDRRKDLLKLAWNVMSEEIKSSEEIEPSRQEKGKAPARPSTGIH